MTILFRDRTAAGKYLAAKLSSYAYRLDALVLALPRGGVPVAYEVAYALGLPLDICLVRKLGVPRHRELAMGAIAPNNIRVFNDELINLLTIPETEIEDVTEIAKRELARQNRAYRGDCPQLKVEGKVVLLIDDGIATGATMRAAIQVLEAQKAREIVVAVPVAPREVYQALSAEVDRVVCLSTPSPFNSISCWYEDFWQTTDDRVHELLRKSSRISQ